MGKDEVADLNQMWARERARDRSFNRGLLLFFIAVVGILALVCAMELARALPLETVYVRDYDVAIESCLDQLAYGPNNTIYYAYHGNTSGASHVYLSHSDDYGDTWYREAVVSPGWRSCTYFYFYSMTVLQDNSTVLAVRGDGGIDGDYAVYLFIRWSPSTTWSWYTVCTSSSGIGCVDVAVNESHILVTSGNYGSAIYTRDFNITSKSFTHTWDLWEGSVGAVTCGCIANKTGVFWLSYVWWTGSYYRLTYESWDRALTRNVDILGSGSTMYLAGFMCYPDTGALASGTSGLLGSYYYIHVQWMDDGGSVINNVELYHSTTAIQQNRVGYAGDGNNIGWVCYYRIDSDDFRFMRAQYNSAQATWQATDTTLFTTPDTNDLGRVFTGMCSYWPRVMGQSPNIMKSGYAIPWLWIDEKGAVDDHLVQAYFSGSFAEISWEPLAIQNTTLLDGYAGVWYVHMFWGVGGSTPYTFDNQTIPVGEDGWLNLTVGGQLYGYCPSATGDYSFNVTLVDFYDNEVTAQVWLTVGEGVGGGEVEDDEWSSPSIISPATWGYLVWVILGLLVLGVLIIWGRGSG